jgi:CDP-paratose 2-epimerase
VAVTNKLYTIFGYKGKQVRDQIHSHDVIRAFEAFASDPRPGEVYNLGGGRQNAASILECMHMIEEIGGYKVNWIYHDEPRMGDHICYISDLRKLYNHFPKWSITIPLRQIIADMICAEEKKLAGPHRNEEMGDMYTSTLGKNI